MASPAAKIAFRIAVAVMVITVLFYVGRPLYWKISATIQEVRENKRTVKQGISQIVYEAQKSVGWFHDESDPGGVVREQRRATNRKLLQFVGRVGSL
ncbi:unnamed protein product [Linum tenue]|uniref:Low-density receptor-like protein n=2 Tax=Linum TaxID=4005 RepID=A0AAV0P8A5_9ROSI|nr:unnamed protein product [Linum tenue]